MWLLHLAIMQSFFMAATLSVLSYTPRIPDSHGTVRKAIEREEGWCSSPAGPRKANGSSSPGGSEPPPAGLPSLIEMAGPCPSLPVSGQDSRHVTELWKRKYTVSYQTSASILTTTVSKQNLFENASSPGWVMSIGGDIWRCLPQPLLEAGPIGLSCCRVRG